MESKHPQFLSRLNSMKQNQLGSSIREHDGEDESPTSQNHVVVLPEATLVAKLMRRLSSKVSPTSNESPFVGTDRLCVGS